MSRTVYYTATTLDGYIADESDSLQWLFDQEEPDAEGPSGYDDFIVAIGAMVMGATTYEWVREHLERTGEAGGGDLAGATLGAGRPLFPRRFDLKLVETGRNGDFVVATYDVVGPRSD